MEHLPLFGLRIWTRRWFLNHAGLQKAWDDFKRGNKKDLYIENMETLIASTCKDGDIETRERRVRDLNLVRQSIKGEGHHRG